eukprot:TRINITY_DN3650_c0_g1_i3.p1 TRINITY_DN3650_c0_g1~~TRINITY_DN3650_c0_g1_i3.p1  ORF type:complete len:278 (+),score=62.51 TRINITY_DN3650_c0_g1_i3:218-1051(+)
MIHTKKAKGLVDSNNDNDNTNTTTSTGTEPHQIENNETTHSLKNGLRLLPGDPLICQLIQAANLFEKLELKSVLSLARTSKQIFKQLSPFIENTFMLQYHQKTNIQHYHPKKLLLSTDNTGSLFSNPCFSNVNKVKIDTKYHFKLPKLPNTITDVTLAYYYNEPISSTKLPSCLTRLTTGPTFDQPVNELPQTLTCLKVGYWFNQPINDLPINLINLELGQMFRQYIRSLPLSVQQVTFYEGYNQPIDHLSKNIQFNVMEWENAEWVLKPYQYQLPQ